MGIITSVADMADSIVKRILPEKASESDILGAKTLIEKAVQDRESLLLASQRDIILAEATSDSWLTKNWRPLLMLLITFIIFNNYVIYPYLSLFTSKAVVLPLPDDLWQLMKIGVGGYVVGRSAEKTVQLLKGK
jgi:uncharacterized membrane protein